MNADRAIDKARAVWQSQTVTPIVMSPSELRRRAAALGTRVRRRNRLEYGAAAAVAVMFALCIPLAPHWLTQAGAGLMVLATIYVTLELRRRSSRAKAPSDEAAACLAHYREALAREHDLLKSVPRWYLAPLLPGLVLFFAGLAVSGSGAVRWGVALAVLLAGAVFVAVWRLNERAARQVAREIETVDALASEV